MRKNSTRLIQLVSMSLLFIFFSSKIFSAQDEAYIIFNNTAGSGQAAIMSNMPTSNSNSCSKNDVLSGNKCNRFSLGANEIQVIQNDGSGKIFNMVGVNNSSSTSYQNKGKKSQSYLFSSDDHLFKIDKFRSIATSLSTTVKSSLPLGSYGTISFQQFINNIAQNRTMYGIVRVMIPLVDTTVPTTPKAPIAANDDGDDDGNGDSSDDDGQQQSSGNDDGGNDDSGSDDGSSGSDDSSEGEGEGDHAHSLSMCGDSDSPSCNEACALGKNSVIKAGMEICGVQLPETAQINIKGALMFDWVNSETMEIFQLDELPKDPQKISFEIAIPLNINASNINSVSQTMSTINDIQSLSGSNRCKGESICDTEIVTPIDFNLVPASSKDMYQFKFETNLDKTTFSKLSRADQFHLLFPSGYADGWSDALNALKISAANWVDLGLFIENDSTDKITPNSVRKESFKDIPALIYTGGLVRITHHTNISGLIYAAQAIEISQKGSGSNQKIPSPPNPDVCTPAPSNDDSNDDGADDDGSKNDDGKDDDGGKDDDSNNSTCGASNDDGSDDNSGDDSSSNDDGSDDSSNDDSKSNDDGSDDSSNDDSKSNDDGSDDSSNDDSKSNDDGSDDSSSDDSASSPQPNKPVKPIVPTKKFTPSLQYIDGAIVVRNGFYFEAIKPNGVTLISNNPDTYSNTEIVRIGGKNNFQAFSDLDSNSDNDQDSSVVTKPLVGSKLMRSKGAKWVEIRPK